MLTHVVTGRTVGRTLFTSMVGKCEGLTFLFTQDEISVLSACCDRRNIGLIETDLIACLSCGSRIYDMDKNYFSVSDISIEFCEEILGSYSDLDPLSAAVSAETLLDTLRSYADSERGFIR